MYVKVGELALVEDHSTVPLTRVSCNTFFPSPKMRVRRGPSVFPNGFVVDTPWYIALTSSKSSSRQKYELWSFFLRFSTVPCLTGTLPVLSWTISPFFLATISKSIKMARFFTYRDYAYFFPDRLLAFASLQLIWEKKYSKTLWLKG